MQCFITLSLMLGAAVAAPYELISKRALNDREWGYNKVDNCPAYLEEGQYEFPHYITHISQQQPDKAFGPQYSGLFTPNDISSIFSFDIPASRADANCTLEFLFPRQDQLETSSFSYQRAGTFFFTGYNPGSCPGPETTFNNQPEPGPFPAFPPMHMEPGYAYTIDIGPCFVGAGTCVAGMTSTNDTSFSFFQDADECAIGVSHWKVPMDTALDQSRGPENPRPQDSELTPENPRQGQLVVLRAPVPVILRSGTLYEGALALVYGWYTNWTSLVYHYETLRGRGPIYVHGLHEVYGPVVRVCPHEVDISDAEAARQIHRVKADFLKTEFYHDADGKINVFNARDPEAHRARESFSRSQFDSKIRLAIQRMGEEMDERGAVDVYKWWNFLTTDVIGQLSFGGSFNMLESSKPRNQYIEDIDSRSITAAVFLFLPFLWKLPASLPIPFMKTVREASVRMTNYAKTSLQRYRDRLGQDTEAEPMLFTKVMKDEADDGGSLTEEDIVHEAELYIVEGSDTTSVTLTYLTWALCRQPELRARVVQETLRRYAVVPGPLPRHVPQSGATLKGYWLPGGSVVRTQNWSLHRDPVAFPDPDTFDPSRWENPTKDMKEAFMAFGSGSRICIGMHLAHIELRLGAAHFFRAFPNATVSNRDAMSDQDMVEDLYFLSSPRGGRCLIAAC
ncbi:Uu.00g145870.m01.CDS01 [Anthostomella pinea]|uniref:Uu.00g145870.m01.CDS01 n=1 Tax=Anthostomella pinea TaxID=933095 RepID=A0AAI8VR76_9PEZI|nr:Uu.00g145870.m01.CDS01 [Anthostomella pinea]